MKRLINFLMLALTFSLSSQVRSVSKTFQQKLEYEQEFAYKFDVQIFEQLDQNDSWLRNHISALNGNYNTLLNTIAQLESRLEQLEASSGQAVDSVLVDRVGTLEVEKARLNDSIASLNADIKSVQWVNNLQAERLTMLLEKINVNDTKYKMIIDTLKQRLRKEEGHNSVQAQAIAQPNDN